MGMHSVVSGCKVLQVDHNDVVDLGSQYGSQEAQRDRPGGQTAVRGICVLSVHGLLVNTANTVGSSFQEHRCMSEIEVERRTKTMRDTDSGVQWLHKRSVCEGKKRKRQLLFLFWDIS